MTIKTFENKYLIEESMVDFQHFVTNFNKGHLLLDIADVLLGLGFS